MFYFQLQGLLAKDSGNILLVARRKRYDDPTPQMHASEETCKKLRCKTL